MKNNFEIHAVDFEICRVMAELDALLHKNVPTWGFLNNGFHVLAQEERQDHLMCRVRPGNWPEGSYIDCRMVYAGGWNVFEGHVLAQHITDFGEDSLLNFSFKCYFAGRRMFIISDQEKKRVFEISNRRYGSDVVDAFTQAKPLPARILD